MKLFIDISDRRYEIEIPPASSGKNITVDGKVINPDCIWLDKNAAVSMIIDGVTYSAELIETEKGCEIQVDGNVFSVEITDERSEAMKKMVGVKQTKTNSDLEIKAPMPGLVVKVNVKEGDLVSKGQGVMVIEAMKMENEIRAQSDCIIKKLCVEPGRAVEKNELLILIEPVDK